jgi:hypothetical protein
VQLRGLGPQRQRPLDACQRLGTALQLLQGHAPVVVCLDALRLEGDRALEARQGFGRAAKIEQHGSLLAVSVGAALEGDRGARAPQRLGVAAELAQRRRAAGQSGHGVGLQRESGVVAVECFGAASERQQSPGKAYVRRGTGAQRDGAADQIDGAIVAAGLAGDEALAIQHLGVARIAAQHVRENPLRLGEAAGTLQREAALALLGECQEHLGRATGRAMTPVP